MTQMSVTQSCYIFLPGNWKIEGIRYERLILVMSAIKLLAAPIKGGKTLKVLKNTDHETQSLVLWSTWVRNTTSQ